LKTLAPRKYEIIQPIWFEIDREYMCEVAKGLTWKQYIHKNGERIDNYTFAHYHDDQIQGFIDTMPFLQQCKWRSSFVRMTGDELEWHTDKNNKCAIIWGLSGWKDAMTIFNTRKSGDRHDHRRKWVYKDAIMDTQVEHKVRLGEKSKMIYKISIIDKDFQWVCRAWAKHYGGFRFD